MCRYVRVSSLSCCSKNKHKHNNQRDSLQRWPHCLTSSKCRLHSLSAHTLSLNSVIVLSFPFSYRRLSLLPWASVHPSDLLFPLPPRPSPSSVLALRSLQQWLITREEKKISDLKQRAWIIRRCSFGLWDVSTVCCCVTVQHLWFLFTVWPAGGDSPFFFLHRSERDGISQHNCSNMNVFSWAHMFVCLSNSLTAVQAFSKV